MFGEGLGEACKGDKEGCSMSGEGGEGCRYGWEIGVYCVGT